MTASSALRFRLISRPSSKIAPAVLGTLTRTNLIAPYYHLVSDVENVYVKHLYGFKTSRQFSEDLDFLLRHYRSIGLQDLLAHQKAGEPITEKVFLLTFDDGFREVFDVIVPILKRKGIDATFFVNSAFVDNRELCYLNKASLLAEKSRANQSVAVGQRILDVLQGGGIRGKDPAAAILSVSYRQRHRLDEVADLLDVDIQDHLRRDQPYLTSSQIRTILDMGFTIGGHSVDHPLYARLSLDEQLEETTTSVIAMREAFGLDYGVFAFPHNDNGVSRAFFERLHETGIVDLSFGTAGLVYDSVPNHLQRFSLEKPLDSAERILAFQQVRKFAKIATGKATILRN